MFLENKFWLLDCYHWFWTPINDKTLIHYFFSKNRLSCKSTYFLTNQHIHSITFNISSTCWNDRFLTPIILLLDWWMIVSQVWQVIWCFQSSSVLYNLMCRCVFVHHKNNCSRKGKICWKCYNQYSFQPYRHLF